MSIVPRLISNIFRNNLKYIKNKEINENGWKSLKNTYESIINTILELEINEYSLSMKMANQEEISKTKYFIHLLSLEKKQLLFELKENTHNCTAQDYNSVLDIKTHRRDKFNETEKKTLLSMIQERQ